MNGTIPQEQQQGNVRRAPTPNPLMKPNIISPNAHRNAAMVPIVDPRGPQQMSIIFCMKLIIVVQHPPTAEQIVLGTAKGPKGSLLTQYKQGPTQHSEIELYIVPRNNHTISDTIENASSSSSIRFISSNIFSPAVIWGRSSGADRNDYIDTEIHLQFLLFLFFILYLLSMSMILILTSL
jgi:hypothetical protein